MKRRFLLTGMFFAFQIAIVADDVDLWKASDVSLYILPQFVMQPTQSSVTYAPSTDIVANFRLRFLPFFSIRGDIGYTALQKESTMLILIDVGPSIGVFLNFGKLGIDIYTGGGIGFGIITDSLQSGTTNTSNPYVAVGANVSYRFSDALSAGFGARYKTYVPIPLYQNIGISASLGYHVPRITSASLTPEVPAKIELNDLELSEVFPVFYKYYDTNSLGSVVIRNGEKSVAENIRVSLFVSQYMDGEKSCATIDSLNAGAEVPIDLYALFNPRILEITEGTKATAEVRVVYQVNDELKTKTVTETLTIYDRNAITWEDDRRAAAFVTRKDPVVLRLSKSATGAVKQDRPVIVNENFANAMVLFETLREYGMNYEIDPSTPMAELHKRKTAIDFIQFPKQTLEYRAGDCDDLSILYAALLESIGVETAFITTPGHIFMAFSTGMRDAEANESFSSTADVIFQNGNAWIPVEVTALNNGFLTAWALGARAWRDGQRNRLSRFYPMHEAWSVYEPVGMPGELTLRYPEESDIAASFRREMALFVQREVRPQEDKIKQSLENRPNDSRLLNRLGVLYGQYQLLDKAEAIFAQMIQNQSGGIAFINMGNIQRLKGDNEKALEYYEIAYAEMPNRVSVVASLASLSYETGDFQRAQVMYEKLRELSPSVAEQYSQLATPDNSGSRAIESIDFRETLIWIED